MATIRKIGMRNKMVSLFEVLSGSLLSEIERESPLEDQTDSFVKSLFEDGHVDFCLSLNQSPLEILAEKVLPRSGFETLKCDNIRLWLRRGVLLPFLLAMTDLHETTCLRDMMILFTEPSICSFTRLKASIRFKASGM